MKNNSGRNQKVHNETQDTVMISLGTDANKWHVHLIINTQAEEEEGLGMERESETKIFLMTYF